MEIKMLQTDAFAQKVVAYVFGKPLSILTNGSIASWVYDIGGTVGVAVFSLSNDTMFMHNVKSHIARSETPRACVSLYNAEDIARSKTVKSVETDLTIKNWNKMQRALLTPKELEKGSYGFMAVNRAAALRQLDAASIFAQLVAYSKHRMPAGTEGRGGFVVFSSLPAKRVIADVKDAPAGLAVEYGSSSLAFTSDMLMALKAAVKLGSTMMFDTEGNQTIMEYLKRTLFESSRIFGEPDLASVDTSILNLNGRGKDVTVSPKFILELFAAVGLTETQSVAAQLAHDDPSAQVWCQRGLYEVARTFLDNLPFATATEVHITDTANIFDAVSGFSVSAIARELETVAGHTLSMFKNPNGERIKTSQVAYLFGNKRLGEVLAQGYLPGGALSYWAWYQKSGRQPFIAYMGDKDAGQVHRLAQPHMEKGNLWVVPGGFLGLYPKWYNGHIAHTSVDPWVLLEIFARVGAEKTRQMVMQIWKAIEVPLQPDRVGWRTYIVISKDDVTVIKNPPGQHLE